MANDQQGQCKECGCKCSKCVSSDHDVHLHVEIENLKQKLVERDSHIATMETNVLNEANKFPNGELAAAQDELMIWQDKYRRLYEAHRRIQRVNQGLEDKLLRLVDTSETDKTALTKDVATLSHKLADANYTIKKLTEDNERYKNDVALAIQFLQCKQGNFVSQKLDSLPNEVQAKVSSYVAGKRKPEEKKTPPEVKSIKVPIPTFPPTAMVYSIPKAGLPDKADADEVDTPSVDIVSAAIMAKVLEERARERALAKHCDTCTCSKNLKIIHDALTHSVGTQTGERDSSLCLRCNAADADTSGVMKIVKESAGTNKSKSVPIYTHDYDSNFLQVGNNGPPVNRPRPNVVKVEPNNYLKETDSVGSRDDSGGAEKASLGRSSHSSKDAQCAPLLQPDRTPPRPNPPVTPLQHHHLCGKSTPDSPDFQLEKCDSSAKKLPGGVGSEPRKGPRYCSVRLQSGSKNILLDNVHNNIAPVLYTHPTDKKWKKDDHNAKILNGITKPHGFDEIIKPESGSKSISSKSIRKTTRSSSSDDCKSVNLVEESIQNQQRVAEWIQSNRGIMGAEGGSSNSSAADSLKISELAVADAARYAEMESNVKKFLFGESQSEFLKKVAIGKQNYQNLRDYSSSMSVEKEQVSRSNSHTETEI